ncbi:dynein axonemal intermediate chain 7 [Bactrocera neohumeralis]|uniref:dynein axonemal intermediate chain 7 n=1 Tax=Bactrocera neohumeralis TaxID=98809 RepID=UPI002165BC9D|nr:dynein axonemal intermediate chain 7 [Bactrocera neohumeralis]
MLVSALTTGLQKPPKKKLSKKEKARLEAEQAELLRIEMEKERQRKLEEERQRRQIEFEQAKRRQKEEIQENKRRRAQLRNSMSFFKEVREVTTGIKALEQEERDWERFMRCNGLPNANSPSDLRRYIHQWRSDMERRERASRNWLLNTNERTLLTQDLDAPDLSRKSLRQRQGNAGDVYAQRIREVLGILAELDEALLDKKKPPHIIADLICLKMEIRVLLSEHLDEFTYKTMSHIDRDMESDRPGVFTHIYVSDVFKSHIWTFSKDAQISVNPKGRIGEQVTSNDIEFPALTLQIALPISVELQSSAMRGLWLDYDHFSDYCDSFKAKRALPEHINMLRYTKREWIKRKDILQNMLEDCTKDSPLSTGAADQDSSSIIAKRERSFDVDKIYAEYEEELSKARRRAIGPESYRLTETDVNLRKYRIIGGVYRIDYLETPQQDKRLNERSFIRTIITPDHLSHKIFYENYKPPPPPQPGVRRLPEEIEAEMRMVEAALDKLALVSLDLPDSVIWFEPPIVCRWETNFETLESNLTDGAKPPLGNAVNTTATPTEATPLSTTTNASPLKGSPRFPAKLRKRSSQKSTIETEYLSTVAAVREVTDFDLFNIPRGIDIYGLLQDFVVPRLPPGFCLRWEKSAPVLSSKRRQREGPAQRLIMLARHRSVNRADEAANDSKALTRTSGGRKSTLQVRQEYITNEFLDWDEPRELFPEMEIKKLIKFKENTSDKRSFGLRSEELKQNQAANGVNQDKLQEHANTKNGVETKRVSLNGVCARNGTTTGNGNGKTNGHSNGANNKEPVLPSAKTGNGQANGNGGAVSDNSSRRSSNETAETASQKMEVVAVRKTYMFSKLLEDLDQLAELQLPLQTDALKRISANLTSPPANGSAELRDAATGDTAAANGQEAERLAEAMQPAFNYYPGFSFLRDLDAKNGVGDNNKDETAELADDEDEDEESSTDEYDDEDAYDGDGWDDEALLENFEASARKDASPSAVANLNSLLNGDAKTLGSINGAGGGTASGGLQQMLAKHRQSESDSSDGKKCKSSNLIALTQGKWSTRDVHDTKFNEEKLSLQFRTGRLGIFGLAMNRYSNMPYQTWEIKPDFKSPGTIFFSFTASIISLDMNITSAGYCVNNFQGGSTPAINDMLGKTLSLAELKSILIAAAVDIFPEPDTFCYTEGTCEKNFVMEMHLYACISTLVQSHNFSWSRWNLLAGSRTIVLLMRELIEGKKVPYHSTLLVTPLKTAIIDCTEVSPSFNSAGITGMEYYADLYQLSQVYALPSSLEKQRNMDPMLRENVARILMAIRPLSFC